MARSVKLILWILGFAALLTLLLALPLSSRQVTWVPALKVDGTLYVSTGNPIQADISNAEIAGRTKTYTENLPRRNGQSNIPSENGLAYAPWEDGLAVEVDGAWLFFKKSTTH